MIIHSAELETVCGITSRLPDNVLPEVAFAGRSNVGKSSLINSILNRKALARISKEPGKTQTLNYYLLNKEIYLVDLPGYGYAKIDRTTREEWGLMIQKYLIGSKMLRYVFLLMDSRHAPSVDDINMFDWLRSMEIDPVIIATKCDKIKPREIEANINTIRKSLGTDEDTIILPFSSVTKEGLDTLLDLLDQVVEQENQV
ncbi:MAG: YihA family ribosome biogenesis GTP-binding protein [Lachnospiraceae bacterium]|jgi:GTP-binding protein|nr:YihA family ribosome biogenesis GTP-binding protein [Lachnospiraceae bacterium]